MRKENFSKFFAYAHKQLGKNKFNDIAVLMKKKKLPAVYKWLKYSMHSTPHTFYLDQKKVLLTLLILIILMAFNFICDQHNVLKYLLTASDFVLG